MSCDLLIIPSCGSFGYFPLGPRTRRSFPLGRLALKSSASLRDTSPLSTQWPGTRRTAPILWISWRSRGCGIIKTTNSPQLALSVGHQQPRTVGKARALIRFQFWRSLDRQRIRPRRITPNARTKNTAFRRSTYIDRWKKRGEKVMKEKRKESSQG